MTERKHKVNLDVVGTEIQLQTTAEHEQHYRRSAKQINSDYQEYHVRYGIAINNDRLNDNKIFKLIALNYAANLNFEREQSEQVLSIMEQFTKEINKLIN